MLEVADKVSAKRNVHIDFGLQIRAAPALIRPIVQASLHDVAECLKVSACSIVSDGGHDCTIFAVHGIRSDVIFIQNENRSHNPDEV